MNAAPLAWTRETPGLYNATGRDGDRWRIAQTTSDRWEVYRNGSNFALWPNTLAEAKSAAEEEDDPDARARREARKAKRAARRAAIASRMEPLS